MAENQERRRFLRLDLNEDVRAVDEQGRDIGRVEKVGAGGMQIRLAPDRKFEPGARFVINILENNDELQRFNVEVKVCDGEILGVQFSDK
jgi:hypothetical protein